MARPTHTFKALDKTNNDRTILGAGWENEDGSITIRLNPCVVIKHDTNILYTLFVRDEKKDKND